VPNGNGVSTIFFCDAGQLCKLDFNRGGVKVIINEEIAVGSSECHLTGKLIRNCFGGSAAV